MVFAMSIVCYHRPGSKARAMAGDVPAWITNNGRANYILMCVLSCPLWVDRTGLNLMRAWARALTVMTGELHVLDHIVPLNHPHVCGLTVPWNLRVVHWRVNGSKGNRWCPDQLELFE